MSKAHSSRHAHLVAAFTASAFALLIVVSLPHADAVTSQAAATNNPKAGCNSTQAKIDKCERKEGLCVTKLKVKYTKCQEKAEKNGKNCEAKVTKKAGTCVKKAKTEEARQKCEAAAEEGNPACEEAFDEANGTCEDIAATQGDCQEASDLCVIDAREAYEDKYNTDFDSACR